MCATAASRSGVPRADYLRGLGYFTKGLLGLMALGFKNPMWRAGARVRAADDAAAEPAGPRVRAGAAGDEEQQQTLCYFYF